MSPRGNTDRITLRLVRKQSRAVKDRYGVCAYAGSQWQAIDSRSRTGPERERHGRALAREWRGGKPP